MSDFFMDYDTGDIGFAFDDFGINSKGEELMHVGDNMIQNLATGEVHFVDHWPGDAEDDLWKDDSDDAGDDLF